MNGREVFTNNLNFYESILKVKLLNWELFKSKILLFCYGFHRVYHIIFFWIYLECMQKSSLSIILWFNKSMYFHLFLFKRDWVMNKILVKLWEFLMALFLFWNWSAKGDSKDVSHFFFRQTYFKKASKAKLILEYQFQFKMTILQTCKSKEKKILIH